VRALAGRTALVTGGGTGIGAATARALGALGARVLLTSRSEAKLAPVAEALAAAGVEAACLPADVRSPELAAALEARGERVDILVNNAAVFATYGPVEEVPPGEVAEVLEVDLGAVLELIRRVLPGMKARGWGRIINLGSVAGSLGAAGQVAYSTAKAGLEGLTRAVAVEAAPHGVTCNLVEPALVLTERTVARIDPAVRDALVRATPAGRPGTPEEVARAITFLAGEAGGAVTGAVLPVDGGIGLR
jgi:NAD(P)-dependent dehydrogenase (short-subunit alcohol dehydrogenase family)